MANSQTKSCRVPHEGSEHAGVDHSLISPRKVDDTGNTPVLSMGLGDVQAPTLLQGAQH